MNSFALDSCAVCFNHLLVNWVVNQTNSGLWAHWTSLLHWQPPVIANAMKFVSGNLGLMSLLHTRHIILSERIPPFINLNNSETVEKLVSYLRTVQKSMGTSKPVSFTVGVDATVVVNSRELLQSYRSIVGGNLPNHFFDVKGKSDEEIFVMMK